MLLPQLGLVIYTFGNVSCIDRKAGVYAIKPSGVDYDTMTWENIVIVERIHRIYLYSKVKEWNGVQFHVRFTNYEKR